MDDIKQFAKNENELEAQTQAVTVKIAMKFGRENRPILKLKSGKPQMTEGIELRIKGKIRTLGENETCKYLKIW